MANGEISIVEYGIRFQHAYKPFCMQRAVIFGQQSSRIIVTNISIYIVVHDGGSWYYR